MFIFQEKLTFIEIPMAPRRIGYGGSEEIFFISRQVVLLKYFERCESDRASTFFLVAGGNRPVRNAIGATHHDDLLTRPVSGLVDEC